MNILLLLLLFSILSYAQNPETMEATATDLVSNVMGVFRGIIGLTIIGYFIKSQNIESVKNNPYPLMYVMFGLLSLLWTGSFTEGIRLFLYNIIVFGIYYICMDEAANHGTERVIKLFLIYSVITLICFLIFGEWREEGTGLLDRGERFSVAGSFNTVAGVLTIFFAFSLGIFSEKDLPPLSYIYAFFLMLASVAITVFTLSRSGWIGMGMIFLFYCILRRKWLFLIILAMLPLAFLLYSDIGLRFLGDYKEAIETASFDLTDMISVPGYQNLAVRYVMWSNALGDLLNKWTLIFGAGAGMDFAWAKSNTNEGTILSEVVGTFLNFGVIGSALLFLAFYVMLKQSRIAWKYGNDPWTRIFGLVAILSLVAFIPRLLWDQILNGIPGWLLLSICGLAGGVSREGYTSNQAKLS